MAVSAVLFDLDDTLMPEVVPDGEALLAACELARGAGTAAAALSAAVVERAEELWKSNPVYERSRDVGVGALEALWGSFEASDPVLGELRDWVPAYRRETWRGALSAGGINDGALSTRIGRVFQDERRKRMVPFADSGPVLARLSEAGHRLGMVTNGASLIQREKLDRSGLVRFFPHPVVSGDIGFGKPDPRLFARALNALGARARDAVMVGNRLERDVQGARNSGIRSVLIRRAGLNPGSGPTPDFEIASLAELPGLLR